MSSDVPYMKYTELLSFSCIELLLSKLNSFDSVLVLLILAHHEKSFLICEKSASVPACLTLVLS